MSGAVAVGLVAASAFGFAALAVSRGDRTSVTARAGVASKARTGARFARASSLRGVGAVFGAVGLVVLGEVLAGPPGAVAGAVVAVATPSALRRGRARAARERVEEQLEDAVTAIASGLRAGRSPRGAFDEAARAVGEPLRSALRRVVDRSTLGIPFDDALASFVADLPGHEGRLVAAVVTLHRRSGGDTPAVLDRVARVLRQRREASREVRALTAQARLSGTILGLLPIGFFLFLSATERRDAELAYRSSVGATAIVVGLMMQALAYVWIRALLRVEP